MTLIEQYKQIASQKDGPRKKFELFKVFGPILSGDGGFAVEDLRTMSCAQLQKLIENIL
jgi:hypothetical protein